MSTKQRHTVILGWFLLHVAPVECRESFKDERWREEQLIYYIYIWFCSDI